MARVAGSRFGWYARISALAGLMAWSAGLLAHGSGGGQVGPSGGMIVTRHFTGIWDQVDQESQGIALQVVEQVSGERRAVAYWYTYGANREPTWYIGIGGLVDNRVEMELYQSTDVGFMQDADPGYDPVSSVGSMSIAFESCQSGEVSFATDLPEVGSGSFRIERLLEVMNTHCSGGISDDQDVEHMFGVQRVELQPVRAGIDAIGHARYEDFPGHMEMAIEVSGLQDGSYQLMVGGRELGSVTVAEGHGEMIFSSPAEDGHLLMNFDPRGILIEIHDGQGAVLSSGDQQFEEQQDHHYGAGMGGDGDEDHPYDCTHMGSGHGMGMGGMPVCVDQGDYLGMETDLENAGVLPGAEGRTEWEMNAYRVRFSVDVEGVPAGSYPLYVGGAQVGVVEAVEMHNGEVYGRLSFRDPQLFGTQPLDFDPRGQKVELLQGSSVILSATIPEE